MVVGLPKTCRWIDFVTIAPFTLYVSVPVLPVGKLSVIVPTLLVVPAAHGELNAEPVGVGSRAAILRSRRAARRTRARPACGARAAR